MQSLVMQHDGVNRGLAITDLREGDILIMLGHTMAATIVCCCLGSCGSSHVGQVVRIGGQLWLAESTIDSAFKQWILPGTGPVHDGVCATRIEDSFAYYNAIDVYRAKDLTSADLDTMSVIACDRIGHVDSVYAIGDPWSWLTRRVTVTVKMKPHCE